MNFDDLLFALVGAACVTVGFLGLTLMVVMAIEVFDDMADRAAGK